MALVSNAVPQETVPMPITQAMILAAGRGARFRPVTDTLPKPLVTLGGKALIDWQIEALLAQGITRIVINCCYLAEQLIAHVQSQDYGCEILFSHEETALETGGGIKRALPFFEGKPFYAVNSDVVLWPESKGYLMQLYRAFTLRPELKLALLLQPTLGAIGLQGAGGFFLPCGRQCVAPRPAKNRAVFLYRRTVHASVRI